MTSFKSGDAQNSSANDARSAIMSNTRSAIMNIQAVAQVCGNEKLIIEFVWPKLYYD